MVLALVGAPSRLSWEAYKAAKALGGALGALLGAAEGAAVGGLVGSTAAAVGAGVGGFMIGEYILKQLELPQTLPPPGEYYEFSIPGQFAEVLVDTFINGVPQNVDLWASIGETPSKGLFNERANGVWQFYFLDKNNNRRLIFSTQSTVDSAEVVIKQFRLSGTNTPLTPTKKLPSYAPNKSNPVKPVPTTIPIPGFPNFPISPRVVPNPGNDPPNENEEREPGVVVQIPETGQQIKYTPSGVQITNFNNPTTAPFRVPPPILPPGINAATPPCCEVEPPEPPEVDLEEIICRLKALQEKVLDDGFDNVSGATAQGASGFYEALDGGFYKVQIDVTQKPSNLRIQPSTAPALDVWYVGWFSWVENGFPGERIPLHFQNSSFVAPPNVTGFMYQVNAGCLAIGRWTRKVKREYVDFCIPADAS